MTQTETVAVLGAGGNMGFRIARNMARAGIPLRAWNRSREKAEPLTEDGAAIADTPADAARGAGIVITMLADGDAAIATMDGPQGALSSMAGAHQENGNRTDDPNGPPHPLWVQMGTIGEAATQRCAELANRHGVGFVDAPVLGAPDVAEKGELVVLESGPEEARPRLQPVFDAVGKRTIRVGEAGAGSRLKLVTNIWLLAIVEAGAETIALAEGLGLDPALFLNAIEGSPLGQTIDSPYMRQKARKMLDRNFTPEFRLALAAKDGALASRAAQEHSLNLPVVDAIARRLAEGAKEHPDMDYSATYLTSAPR
jgi:3-hydroxyisobutyrate dehydrogenase